MIMIMKEIEGDLIGLAKEGEFDMIVHGCNCQNVMGGGIASQIKKMFPEAFQEDKELYDEFYLSGVDQQIKLGNYICTHIDFYKLIVVNAYTQIKPGPDATYLAVKSCFGLLNTEFKDHNLKIGIPLIGCGIGGLDWCIVKSVIERAAPDLDITAVIYKP